MTSGAPSVCNARDYGAVGNGIANDTAAIQRALTDAQALARPLYIPAGNYLCTGPLTAHNIDIYGDGRSTSLSFSALGTGIAALTAGCDSFRGGSVRRLSLNGPGSYALGVKNAHVDGLKITGGVILEEVSSNSFDSGFVSYCGSGHTALRSCSATHNYYGYYTPPGLPGNLDGGDNFLEDCDLSGNNMASIANGPGVCLNGFVALRVHMGFSPYAVYGEGGATAQFNWMNEALFLFARHEQCGNGAWFHEDAQFGYGMLAYLTIKAPGHSWGAQAGTKITTRAADYAVVAGDTGGGCEYDGRGSGFQAGAIGTWYFHTNTQSIWRMTPLTPELITIGPGGGLTSTFGVTVDNAPTQGIGTIPTGQTSVTVGPGEYIGAVDSLAPVVTPTSTGGLTGPFTLLVSNVTSVAVSPTVHGSTTITVTLLASAPTTAPLTFSYRLR